jgi:hypothetical protein
MFRSLSISLFFIMCFQNCFADVWVATNSWNDHWEKNYQSWLQKRLTKTIFTKDEGILNGIETDCADAIYDIRIAFSYEYSLPFIINTPSSMKSTEKIFGNNTKMFDHIKDERARVRAFIHFVNGEVGTDELMKDTFPVGIKKIGAGTVYVVKWSLFGKINHHSYVLKGFDENHELLYYASDAPVKLWKMQIDTPYPRFSYETAPFGYRYWKWPEHLLIEEKLIPKELGYSDEQYKLLDQVGKKNILREIHDRL